MCHLRGKMYTDTVLESSYTGNKESVPILCNLVVIRRRCTTFITWVFLIDVFSPRPRVISVQNKAVEFSKLQICVDLFLFSGQYTDVATLANLPKFTAGQLFYYPVGNGSDTFIGEESSSHMTEVD